MERLGAVSKNLLDLKEDEKNLAKCRSAHLREAAYLISRADPDGDLDILRDGYISARDQLCDEVGLNKDERIILCSHLSEFIAGGSDDREILKKFLQAEEAPDSPVICYLRNPIADLAYTEFVREIPKAGVLYADSFQAVCENLIDGESDYAILPLVSGSDGRLSRFEAMISSYGFVISAVAAVTPNPDSPSDRFALLSRSAELPRKASAAECLHLKITIPSSGDPGALISAARESGAELIETGTVYQDSRKSFSFAFEITNANLAVLLTYLAFEEGGFVVNGLFTTQKTPD